MCIACVLLCLTLFSFRLCGGLYSRYTSADSALDSARVAKFDVSENGAYFAESMLIETVPGTQERTIRVVNNSEVAVAYSVTIDNTTRNIPYSFSVDGSAPEAGKCVVVKNLEPNSTYDLVITATWNQEDSLNYMGMVDLIELTVRAEQID